MTRDLKSAYRHNEPMTLDERAEAQREICAEYRWQVYGSGQAGQGDTAGFVATLTPDQRVAALAYNGPDGHGDTAGTAPQSE